VQTFDRLPLPERFNETLNEAPNGTSNGTLNRTIENRVRLREGGVYLITGAWGDVSLVLAEYLAQTVQAKLILLEHPDCPERDTWGQQKLQHIRALSPEVLFIQADVANLEQMQAAITQIDQQFGALHGVIHAAETNQEAAFRPIQQTTVQDCEWHFQPKAYGLYGLATILQGRSLDFCLLQSSLSPLVGGFAAHAAANGFMDAFAHQQSRIHSFPWISINWEGWQFWEERQLVVGSQKTADWALLPNEGIVAFQRLLHAFDDSPIPSPQIIVSTVDLPARMTRHHAAVTNRISASTPESVSFDLPAEPPLRKDAPHNAIEQAIANIWQDLLGVESIGIHDNFFDLGGHSLLAVQTISRLREIFQVEIPLRSLLLETPTIAGLAGVIATHQPPSSALDEMAQMLAEIEQLSSTEIQAKLAQESQASL
jgi:acyl carrier protein